MASLRLHLLAALSLAASLTIQSAGQEVRAQLRRSSYLQSLAALQPDRCARARLGRRSYLQLNARTLEPTYRRYTLCRR